MINKLLRDILTNADGVTYCHARVSGFISTLIYWVMAGITVWQTKHFDYMGFATGYAAILAGICGGAWLKRDTESS